MFINSGGTATFKNVKYFKANSEKERSLRAVNGTLDIIAADTGAEIEAGLVEVGYKNNTNVATLKIANANGTNEIDHFKIFGAATADVSGETTVKSKLETFKASTSTFDNLTVKGQFINQGTLNTKVLELNDTSWANHTIGGTINASEMFLYKTLGFARALADDAVITTKLLKIEGAEFQVGLAVKNNSQIENVDAIEIVSAGNAKVGLALDGKNIALKNVTLTRTGTNQDARIEMYKDSSATIDSLTATSAGTKIQLNENANATISSINVADGATLSIASWSPNDVHDQVATVNLSNIVIGEGATLNATVQTDYSGVNELNIQGESVKIDLGKGGVVDFGGKNHKLWSTEKTKVNAEEIVINVADVADAGKVYLSDSTKSSVSVFADVSSDQLSGDVKTDLGNLAQVVQMTSEETPDGEATARQAEGVALTIAETDVYGQMTAVTTADGLKDVVEAVNTKTAAVAESMVVLPSMMTRILTNDLRKRLGDVRAGEGTHGAWVRYNGGAMSGLGLDTDFNMVQVGIDTVPEVGAPRFGVAFSYAQSETDAAVSNESDQYSLAFYGTQMYDNGMFVDVIGRMASIKTEMTGPMGNKADLDNVALSLSGEFGWRFDVNDSFYVEPAVEATYTYVNAENFTLGSVNYEMDSVDSLVGRVGFAAGFKCPANMGDLYVRVAAAHEFLGDATLGVNNGVRSYDKNGEDTWFEYAIGANFNINKNTYVYADVERTSGAEVDEDWRANVGVRFAF